MNSNGREKFSFAAQVLGFIVDAGSAVSWIVSLVAAIALGSQTEAPKFPGINITLGPWYQFILLLSSMLAYIHLLRQYWLKDDSPDDPLSDSFGDFLWSDLLQFKRPLLLIPIFLFFVFWIGLACSTLVSTNPEDAFIGFFLLFLLVLAGFFAIVIRIRIQDQKRVKMWNRNPFLQNLWIERIERKLRENGYADTEMFEDNVGLSLTSKIDNQQVNWALKLYFNRYEAEQGLSLSKKYRRLRFKEDSSSVYVECYRLSYLERF